MGRCRGKGEAMRAYQEKKTKNERPPQRQPTNIRKRPGNEAGGDVSGHELTGTCGPTTPDDATCRSQWARGKSNSRIVRSAKKKQWTADWPLDNNRAEDCSTRGLKKEQENRDPVPSPPHSRQKDLGSTHANRRDGN